MARSWSHLNFRIKSLDFIGPGVGPLIFGVQNNITKTVLLDD